MSQLLSFDPTSVILGGVVLLCLLWWLSTRRPSGLPPGPGPALPLLGHLHLLAKDPRPQFWRWRRQYGDVFSLYMGGRLVVMLASYSAIHEALVTFADVFSDRPHLFAFDVVTKGKGLVGSSGLTWKEQRKTGLGILRAMGMGKNVLAEKIQEEIIHYIQAIKDYRGKPAYLCQLTENSISNNICSIAFGRRFQYDDTWFHSYLQVFRDLFKLLKGTAALNFLPVLRYIPGDPFKAKHVLAYVDHLYGFIDKHLADHQKSLEEGKEDLTKDTDFIYRYIHQMQEQNAVGNVTTTLNEDNLQTCLLDLFAAGTETTSSVLGWALLFFLHYPHVQDKCFKEISDVIGSERLPAMQDKPNLPYLEATIWEVLRKGDVVPLSVQHTCDRDVMFRGYVIPKGAVVISFENCLQQDPEIWGDPENFRPERFIGPDGKLTRPKEFIPFGIGRRACLGESLARMELFLYLATLIQHFHFLPPEEGQLPSLEGELGVTYTAQPYKIRAVPRI